MKVGDITITKIFFGLYFKFKVLERFSDRHEKYVEFSDFENAVIFSKLCQMDSKGERK